MTEIITKEMQEVRRLIAETVAKREALKAEMQEWYERFKDLIAADGVLSQLDTHYKQLWDFHNARGQSA